MAPPHHRRWCTVAGPAAGSRRRRFLLLTQPTVVGVLSLSLLLLCLFFVANGLAAMWTRPESSWLLGLLFPAAATTAAAATTSAEAAAVQLETTSVAGSGSSTATATSSQSVPPSAAGSLSPAVDLGWYPSGQTPYNNLTAVIGGGPGVPKFTFDPSGNWTDGESNWCNMPHVRREEYVRPSDEYELVYVELMHRHHKRTPYAANAFPVESYRWNCDDQGLFFFGQPLAPSPSGREDNRAAEVYWRGQVSALNPFASSAAGWIGTCQFPQITLGGLQDSRRHGADLHGVYHDLLGFLPGRDDETTWRDVVRYRVTNNVITSQVAGMVVGGMWGSSTTPVPLTIQAAGVDGLEPQYSCPAASTAFSSIQSTASSPAWAAHLAAAAPAYAELDDISGVPATDAGFHRSLDHYYDNMSARQCHAKPLPCKLVTGSDGVLVNDTTRCVGEDLRDEVYRLGHWEYAHVYRGQAESLGASAASIGVWVAELAANLRVAAAAGAGAAGCNGEADCNRVRYRHNVAHDGSVSRLLGVLQIEEMVWPGMGAEVVFELWRRKKSGDDAMFVRVLFSGKVLESASPTLGTMDMVPLERLLAYFDGLVGERAGLIVGKCNGTFPLY